MLFLISIRSFFLTFCVSRYIIMYVLNTARAIKKMSVNELIDFIFEKYYKRIWFSCYYSMKLLKKRFIVAYKQINWKNAWSSLCWQTLSIIYKKEKHKISKTIRNNYLSTKNFWKPKHCWYKISYYRTSKNFAKIIQDWKSRF